MRAERDELAVAVRVWRRMSEQLVDERATARSPVVQVARRAVWTATMIGCGSSGSCEVV
ncbi:hypothetical protein V1460_12345 [Streptomyces sp. SCSIO 30461]|uniref:hypothetical protein n=1 Tax=Streptomyces sp. SCSIO 30461 TaxID=3118085 RepID=UPI0030D5F3A6